MGVYINMDMPKKTYAHCMLIKDIDGSVQLHVCTKNSEEISEWEFYDLVPVPPHGDLIDRDALRASFRESIEECHKWADEVDKDTMMYARISQSIGTFVECSLRAKAAPTIITAEEGET